MCANSDVVNYTRLYRYSKNELLMYGDKGYKVCPCKDVDELLEVRKILKANGRRAVVGTYKKDNVLKYIVLTKEA